MTGYLRYFLLLTLGCLANSITTPPPKCKNELHQLGDVQGNFIKCTIDNSVPAKSCAECYVFYHQVVEKYEILMFNCSDLVLNKNRLNIVYSMQNTLVEIWNRGFCDDCFEGGFLSNETLKFDQLKLNFDDCLKRTTTEDKCSICQGDYADLNSFYMQMDQQKKGKICFDTQDAMNLTRLTWSKDLKCCQREFNLTLFLVCATIFSAIPLSFYLSMYGYTKRLEMNHPVIDSTFEPENQPIVASTSSGISSGATSASLQNQPVTSSSSNAVDDIDDIKKKRDEPIEGPSSSGQQSANLIKL